ncbi:hypothetical protein GCM10027093_62350 [Paraburkholderia jirisanensis]
MTTLYHPRPVAPRTVLGEAFVVSLVIEAVLVVALAGGFTRQTSKPQPKPPEPIKLTIAAPTLAAPAPAPPPPVKPPVPLKPSPAHEPRQPAVVRHSEKASVPKPELPKAAAPSELPVPAHDQAPAQDAPTPPARPSPPPPEAQPPRPSATAQPEAKPSALFQASLRDAVQAAVRYPSAARIMRLTGHVRLGFAYQDGSISNPRVVQSSGQKMLDDAALAALSSTSFPAPPPELKGHLLNLEIVVTFAPSS